MSLTPSPLRLTKPLFDVYQLIMEGYSNQVIAAHISVSEKTVKARITRILKNTLCTSRAELIVAHYKKQVVLELIDPVPAPGQSKHPPACVKCGGGEYRHGKPGWRCDGFESPVF